MTAPNLRPAIFLDKDGTLLEDVPHNVDPAKMRYAPRAQTALRRLAPLDAPLIVVTDQSGIAFGRFAPADLAAVETELAKMFAHCGARLTGFYACPHHPRGTVPDYAFDCLCRKPMPGLLRRAAAGHGIDLRRSWFVGRLLDDVEAAHRAGCRAILIDNGDEAEWRVDARAAQLRRPDHVAPDLAVAARIIGGLLTGPGHDPCDGPGHRPSAVVGAAHRR